MGKWVVLAIWVVAYVGGITYFKWDTRRMRRARDAKRADALARAAAISEELDLYDDTR